MPIKSTDALRPNREGQRTPDWASAKKILSNAGPFPKTAPIKEQTVMNTFIRSSIVAAVFSASSLHAANLLTPTDTIIGGAVQGGDFVVGAVGTVGGANNWPTAEPPADLINGLIGGGGEKYLNFAKLNTGVIVTPAAGLSVINSMTLWVANDAPERDPASYELYGTNAAVSGAGPFPLSGFSLISSGPLALPDSRDTTVDTTGFDQTVAITGAGAFTSYLLVFPTVKNEVTANSMQISELQFQATLIPEPSVALLGAAGALGLIARRRRD